MPPPEPSAAPAPPRPLATAGASPAGGVGAGLAALAAVQVCFGLFPVFGRLAMDPGAGFAPFAVATWRIGVGAVALLLMAFAVYGRRALPARRDLVPLAWFGFLGIVLNQGLFLVGLERSTPMNAALVICMIPVFAYGVAVLSRKERFVPTRALGVAVSLAASVPLFVQRGAELSADHALGNGLMALNALCYACYLVWSKPVLTRLPALVLVAWIYVLSTPWLPLFAAGQDLAPAQASRSAWWSLGYVLVFPTIVAYALNSYALARVQASTTAFFIFAQPLVTATAAYLLLDERLTPALALAAAGLFVGMALVARRPA